MTLPSPDRLFRALDRTWQPHATHRVAGWQVREGRGGGKRVSAASRAGQGAASRAGQGAAIAAAEARHRALGQPPLFMIRMGEDDLDTVLAQQGYAIIDPVCFYAAQAALLADPGPPHRVITTSFPLAIQRELWAEGGIGPARIEVMQRPTSPHAFLLIRDGQRPAGCVYVAADDEVAMLHALEVRPGFRRRGHGAILTRAAAHWAVEAGCQHLALAVTTANTAARALYSGLGLAECATYHYRQHTP